MSSFYNSVMALGSISFASLILAFIKILEMIIEDLEDKEKKNNKKKSLGDQIICCIAKFLLNIFGDLVEFINKITFPYLSIHGDSFYDSAVQSFTIFKNSQFKPLFSIYGVDWIVGLFSTIYFAFSFYLCHFLLTYYNFKDTLSKTIIISGFMLLLFISIFELLRSAVLAIFYKTIDSPKSILAYDQDLYESIKKYSNILETVTIN